MAKIKPSVFIYGVVKRPHIKPARIDESTGEVKSKPEFRCQLEVEHEQDDDTSSFEFIDLKVKNQGHYDFLRQVTGKIIMLPVSKYSFKSDTGQIVSGFSLSKQASIFEIKNIEVGLNYSTVDANNLPLPKTSEPINSAPLSAPPVKPI